MAYRVLLIAEAANPEWVSVPLVGWSLFAALRSAAQRKGGSVHLVTQMRNRDAILRAGLVEGVDFTAIDTEFIARPIYRLSQILRMGEGRGWTMVQAVNALAYPWFERMVWQAFGAEISGGQFDIVHRVTPLSPTVPSALAGRCREVSVPFVIGPLNGGVPWPKAFDGARRQEREWLSYLRGLNGLRPSVRRTYREAAAVIAGSRHNQAEVGRMTGRPVHYLPENAVDPARFQIRVRPERTAGPLRIAFVGRLVPYKGADMLLEAAAPLLRQGRASLDIAGDGPQRAELERQVAALGLQGEAVRLHGWLDHGRVAEVMREADIFGFPSVREFGGGVVLEAMALGVPPLIVDYAGPGELVEDGVNGMKVPMSDRMGIVSALRGRLEAIEADPSVLGPMSRRAAARVQEEFTWQAKADAVHAIYAGLGGRDQSGR